MLPNQILCQNIVQSVGDFAIKRSIYLVSSVGNFWLLNVSKRSDPHFLLIVSELYQLRLLVVFSVDLCLCFPVNGIS